MSHQLTELQQAYIEVSLDLLYRTVHQMAPIAKWRYALVEGLKAQLTSGELYQADNEILKLM